MAKKRKAGPCASGNEPGRMRPKIKRGAAKGESGNTGWERYIERERVSLGHKNPSKGPKNEQIRLMKKPEDHGGGFRGGWALCDFSK